MRPIRTIHVVLLTLVLAGVLTGMARAGETEEAPEETTFLADIEIEVEVATASKYVWRGLDIVDDWVLQPSVDFYYEGFDFNIWANLDLTDENDQDGNFTEVDVEGSYTFDLEPFELNVGAVTYLYPTGDDGTVELFGILTLDVLLSPSLTIYQDVDESDGTYVALGIEHTFEDLIPLGDERAISLDLTASLGWGSSNHNEYNYGAGDAGLADLTLGAGASVGILENLSAAASVNYSTLLTDDIRDALDDTDNVWFTLTLTLSF